MVLRPRAGAAQQGPQGGAVAYPSVMVDQQRETVKMCPEHTSGTAPCMSYVLSLHDRPCQSVLSHRPCRPSRIDRDQRLLGLVPGGLAASGGSRREASGVHPRPVTAVTEALVFLRARKIRPRGSGKVSRGDTRAGSQQVDLGCGAGVWWLSRSPEGQEQGDPRGHLAGAGQLSRDIVEWMLELCGPARQVKVMQGQMCVLASLL